MSPLKTNIVADQRGGVALLMAGFIPIAIGFAAFAIDLGAITLETRRLQGLADAAALAAASDPGHAQAKAEAIVAASGWSRSIAVTTRLGSYSTAIGTTPATRFTANASASDAVSVTLATPSPTYFARIFGRQSVPIARTATAARERLAAFSVGSRLAAVSGGIVNGYLSALTGSTVSLTVMDYNGLAGADVDLFAYLSALRTTAHLQAATFDDVLAAQVTQGQALGALATTIERTSPLQAAALRTLASQVGVRGLTLDGLVDAGKFGTLTTGGTGLVKLNVLSLVTAMLQIASPTRQVAVDLGAGIPGLASTRVTIAIGERPANSPWVAISDNGDPVLRTAQARVYVDTQLANVALPGLGNVVGIRLPIYTELASAQARLSGIDCATATSRGVTIEAKPSPGLAAIAVVDTTQLSDFTTPVTLSNAHLVDTLLVDVDGSAQVDLGAAETWQSLRFTQAQIDSGAIQTVSSNAPVQGIAASLVSRVTLTLRVLGLPLGLGGLTSAVGTQLGVVAPAIDTLLATATGTLGVHDGQADVRVTGMRCGTATLVA